MIKWYSIILLTRMRMSAVDGSKVTTPLALVRSMAARYIPGAGSIEIPLRDTDEVSLYTYYNSYENSLMHVSLA